MNTARSSKGSPLKRSATKTKPLEIEQLKNELAAVSTRLEVTMRAECVARS